MTDSSASAATPESAQTPESDQLDEIRAGYATEEPVLRLGATVIDGQAHPDAPVQIPLSVLNRHGLVAGATGTGKDEDAAADGRTAVRAGRAGLSGRPQG